MKATLTSKESGRTITVKLGGDKLALEERIHIVPDTVRLYDDKEWDIDILPENETEKKLMTLLRPADNLGQLNSLLFAMNDTHTSVRPEIERMLLDGEIHDAEELQEAMLRTVEEIAPVVETFRFPLIGMLVGGYDEDEDDFDETETPVDSADLLWYADEIRQALALEQYPYDYDMADFVDERELAHDKLISMRWSVEEYDGELVGRVSVYLLEPLDEDERAYVTDYITGQNSDGLGEGFEQRPVKTDFGEIEVSMWHSGDDYEVSEGETRFNTGEQNYS